ncbi:hypothetical protein C5167_025778 [Papaver somniferum]|uniref:Uncharacterized protein n=1 Tax=Papaver somniferum TaxID=3469 RepID=A0A4Y7JVN3_PAPSO|nr:hypothetical protein C5167_025778 [Papaver somniferum]
MHPYRVHNSCGLDFTHNFTDEYCRSRFIKRDTFDSIAIFIYPSVPTSVPAAGKPRAESEKSEKPRKKSRRFLTDEGYIGSLADTRIRGLTDLDISSAPDGGNFRGSWGRHTSYVQLAIYYSKTTKVTLTSICGHGNGLGLIPKVQLY